MKDKVHAGVYFTQKNLDTGYFHIDLIDTYLLPLKFKIFSRMTTPCLLYFYVNDYIFLATGKCIPNTYH